MTATLEVETLIVSHPNADFDAFAGMLAAQLLYPGARICMHGGVNRNVREFHNLHADQIPTVEPSALDRDSVRRLVMIEVTEPERLGDLAEMAEREDVDVIAFDHHSDAKLARGTTLVADDGAVVTGMVRLLLERDARISPMHATAFALGIHEDTGSLTYASTTHRDIEALAACVRLGANQEQLARYLRGPLTREQRDLLRRLLSAREEHMIGGLRVVAAAAHAGRYVEDASALVSRVGDTVAWDALVLSVEMEGRVLVIARSHSSSLSVDAALEPLGGGGHAQAASALVRDSDPETVLARVLAEIERVAREPLRAREVMSRPVHSVAGSDMIAAALAECQRLGLSGIQVSENGDLTGVVSREDLDRAVRHGLSHAPVRGVMSRGVDVIGGDATLRELRDLLASGQAGRLVVVSEGPHRAEQRVPIDGAAGVVTRGDVLRALHEPVSVEHPVPDAEATAAVRARLGEIERLREVLPALSAVAAAYDGVYLVGGAVRDVLLGEQSLDLDVMVEGDAIALAGELARALGGHTHPHEKFHTAVVTAVNAEGREIRVDLAGARTEFYDAPGALPEVERSTLRHDLARRDFTINAMATSLRPDDLGATYDFFGGYPDLRRATVRVLHNLSFVEDPTRLLRAIRYEARLGFRMDNHTLSLARGCIEMRLVGDLSSARLRDELLDILAEPHVIEALRRMAAIGLDRALHPHVDALAACDLVVRADDAMQGRLARARTPLVRLACLCAGMPGHEIYEWLGRLKIRRRDQDVVAAAVTLGPKIAERLAGPEAPAPSAMQELLDGQPLEVLVMAIVTAERSGLVEERLHGYLERVRGMRLEITGEDLKAAGVPESPEIGAALRDTLGLKLDGFVSGRDEELRAALRFLGR